ncbi:hypothetical protein EDC04DRAFT_2886504 [Pisolithus marmoratus]|nr:hypothetical protein EDC04DRAFT_2886504 [Pisolithus marmoratus]
MLLDGSTQRDATDSSSPPPPPPATRQLMSEGKYYFTAEENEYFCQFARYHLGRDPSMPTHALLQKLVRKVPHGNAIVDRKLKGKLERIRKKASIAEREGTAHDRSPSSGSTCGNQESFEPVSYKKHGTSSSPPVIYDQLPSTMDSDQDPEKEDFDNICTFFASGGGDDD